MLHKSIILFIIFALYKNYVNLCGTPSIRPSILAKNLNRLIGGDETIPNSWPWVVSIRVENGKYHICGGSLITYQHVLTAANCVVNKTIDQLSVVLGSHNLNDTLSNKNNIAVSKVILHPNFQPNYVVDNIAILKLTRVWSKTSIKNKISIICLPPDEDETFVYQKNVVVAGWGSTTGKIDRDDVSNELHQIQLKVLNGPQCRKYKGITYCAKDATGKQSNICYGDAGSPMMIARKNRWYLYGIASFVSIDRTKLTCLNNEPSYFTIVPRYIEWINITLNAMNKKPKL